MLTVIIPAYRPQNYLLDCLLSLEKQTIERNYFEILVVLNGEKEPYFTDIQSHINNSELDNARIIYTGEKGVSNARNIGLNHAKGNYIVFLDDDDFLSDNYLADLYRKIDGREDAIAVSNVKTYDPVTQIKGTDYFLSRAFKHTMEGRFSVRCHRSFFSTVWGKIIPVNVIDTVRFNPQMHISEDAVFMFAISKHIKQILLSDAASIYYVTLTPDSASRKKSSFISHVQNMYNAIKNFSVIYFSDSKNYSLSFYLNRVFASFYNFLTKIIE